MMSYTGLPDVRPSRTAALSSSDLVQRDTRVMQEQSARETHAAIPLDEVPEQDALVFAVVDAQSDPCVECLLGAGRPPQVPAFISSLIVDPVDFKFLSERLAGVADGAHVVDEGEGVEELLGEPDAPAAVVAVATVERVLAPSPDAEPLAPNPLVDLIGNPPPHAQLPLLRRVLLCARLAPGRRTLLHIVPQRLNLRSAFRAETPHPQVDTVLPVRRDRVLAHQDG